MKSNIFNILSILLLLLLLLLLPLLEYGVLCLLTPFLCYQIFIFEVGIIDLSSNKVSAISRYLLFFSQVEQICSLSWSAVSRYPVVFSHSADILFTCFLCPTFFLRYLFLILFAAHTFFFHSLQVVCKLDLVFESWFCFGPTRLQHQFLLQVHLEWSAL